MINAIREIPWCKIVKPRRVTWYGHLFTLPEDTRARKSLKEAKIPKHSKKQRWQFPKAQVKEHESVQFRSSAGHIDQGIDRY